MGDWREGDWREGAAMPRELLKYDPHRHPNIVTGAAARVEAPPAPEEPRLTFDWGSGGQLVQGGGGAKLAKDVYTIAAGWLAAVGALCAFAFLFVAIAIWGGTNNYAGLGKKDARDVSVRLLNKLDHSDWHFVSATHASIFGRSAWSFKYKRPDATNRCIFVWEDGRTKHRMSRLSKCVPGSQ